MSNSRLDIFKKIVTLENEADGFGFRWEKAEQIIAQIKSECVEISAHFDDVTARLKLQEEIGDLLHAVFSLCVFCQFDPEETLQKSMMKFERRFNAVKQLALEQGFTTLQGWSFDKLMRIWDQAKLRVG